MSVTAEAGVQRAPVQFDEECDRVAALLMDAIAAEQVPEEITRLARELQAALDARRTSPKPE